MRARVHTMRGRESTAGLDIAAGENASDPEPEQTKKSAAVETRAVRAGHEVAPVSNGTADSDRACGNLPPCPVRHQDRDTEDGHDCGRLPPLAVG